MTENIRQSGGYRGLHSFRAATVIYDGTVSFCDRFVDRKSRTRDQMVQAARSGRQNIAEGSRAAATSSQTELRLVNVARPASTSCCSTSRIFCGSASCRGGGKTIGLRARCGRWGGSIGPIGRIGPISPIKLLSPVTQPGSTMPTHQWWRTLLFA